MSFLRRTLRSLRHRDYRLYFFGQFLSMTGTWMQGTALSWLVYRLTGSPLLLGLLGFAGQIPTLLLGLWGGALADRYDKRRLALWTQSLSLLQAAVLAALTLAGKVSIGQVFALAMFLGLVNAVDMPVRQAFVAELVDRPDVGNAIALNSTMVNASRIVGPAAAGFLIASSGEGICFLINAVSYLAAIAALLMMRREGIHPRPEGLEGVSGRFIRDGLGYVAAQPRMRSVLMLLAAMSLVSVPFLILLPIFAQDILHAGARGLGLLTAAGGLGAVLGALALARLEDSRGLERLLGLGAMAFGAALFLFALSGRMALSLLLMVAAGGAMMSTFAGSNTLLQELTADAMRGRVMSLFTMTFMGVAPVGNLLAGAAAHQAGAPLTVAAGGLATVLAGWLYLRRVTSRSPAGTRSPTGSW